MSERMRAASHIGDACAFSEARYGLVRMAAVHRRAVPIYNSVSLQPMMPLRHER